MKISIAKILTLAVISVFVFSCSKNDNKGKLGLKFVGVNNTIFNTSEVINFEFEFNHPSSGKANDTLLVKRRFLSCPYINKDSFKYSVPEFFATANTPGAYIMNFQYGAGGSYNGCTNGVISRTDSLYYTFILIDNNNNRSDSVVSPKITLKK